MAKNISDQSLKNIFPNALREVKNQVKQGRTNQISPDGFFPLPTRTADPVGAPDGSLYYNSSTNKVRKKTAGVWSDI